MFILSNLLEVLLRLYWAARIAGGSEAEMCKRVIPMHGRAIHFPGDTYFKLADLNSI